MPRTATVNKPGTTLPAPSSIPRNVHVIIPKNGPKTMIVKRGGRRSTRRRSTRRRRN